MTGAAAQPGYFDKFDASGSRSADAARQILETTRAYRSVSDEELVVLDVGCGYGHTAAAIAPRCRGVAAMEPSPELFERARATLGAMSNAELRAIGVEGVTERET